MTIKTQRNATRSFIYLEMYTEQDDLLAGVIETQMVVGEVREKVEAMRGTIIDCYVVNPNKGDAITCFRDLLMNRKSNKVFE